MRHAWLLIQNAFARRGCDTFAKWRNLKSEGLSSTSVRTGMPPKEMHECIRWEGVSFL